MRKIIFALLASTALSVAGSALAADFGRPAPPPPVLAPPPPPAWNGFYIGGNLGWANTRGEIDDVNGVHSTNPGWQDVSSANAFTLSGQIGFDFQIAQSFVLGIVGDVSGIFGEDAFCADATCAVDADGVPALSYNVTGLASIAARAGFLLTPQTLIYGLGGWAVGSVTTHHWDSFDYDGSARLFSGWTAGFGAEQLVTQRASLSIEGRYYDLGDKHWVDSSTDPFGAAPNLWTLTLGGKYRF